MKEITVLALAILMFSQLHGQITQNNWLVGGIANFSSIKNTSNVASDNETSFYEKNINIFVSIDCTITTIGQLKERFIEITTYLNFDKYPGFRYHINPTYDHVINLKGNSWGIDLGYKFSVSKKILLKPFIGFYRFSFNNIDNYNEGFNVHSNARVITSPPSPTFWIYSSDKYFYECANFGLSAENEFMKRKFLSIFGGILINNYITFSQKYFLTNNPDQIEDPRKRNRVDLFGFKVSTFAKFLIPIDKFKIGPAISLPIYTLSKTDAEFPNENNSDTRNKWLNGCGIAIAVSWDVK